MDQHIASTTKASNLLRYLFGDQKETMKVLAPKGWPASAYYKLAHPDAARLYQEAIQQYENWKRWLGIKKAPPSLDEIQAEYQERPCYPEDELTSLLGECIWNIFSNNHTVMGPEGEAYHLGSFRGSGRFIAEFINQYYPSQRVTYGYLDFYCAGWLHHARADLTPVYSLMFGRLQEKHCTWIYSFPRTYLIDLGKKEQDRADKHETYDPAEALQRDLQKKKKAQELKDFRQSLDDDFEQRKEEARFSPPPEPVTAYRQMYGEWPKGWIF